MIKTIKGGVTAPKGFKAGGYAAGLKKDGAMDVAMIISEVPAATAICVTQNMVKAAPVLWDSQCVAQNPYMQAIIANSGNANACTGELGTKHVMETAQRVSTMTGIAPEKVVVSSTGVIGVPLPIEKILKGIDALVSTLMDDAKGANAAAHAIMTTDLVQKVMAVETRVGDTTVHIGAMAKGSGMICPNMATMLSFVTSDVAIEPAALQEMLDAIVPDTYNMMSVDGDMSTNDTVVVLANGLAGNELIRREDKGSPEYQAFYNALYTINETQAKNIVRDGEGATKFITSRVTGAASKADAKILAKAVIQSSLVKTAIFGEDANWGRVLSSIGASGPVFDPMGV